MALLIEQPPADLLAADEALLDAPPPPGDATVRWYRASAPALVLGFAQRLQAAALVDCARCEARGVTVIGRRAGGGAVLLDAHMLCVTLAIGLPHRLVGDDVTESYRWLGDTVVAALDDLGIGGVRRVETAEARAKAALRSRQDAVGGLLRATCFGSVSPHEVVCAARKVVGFAQVRRRRVALMQVGVLMRSQGDLADLLRIADPGIRQAYRAEVHRRTVGIEELVGHATNPAELIERLEPRLLAQLRM